MYLTPVDMDDTSSASIITEGEESHSICDCYVSLHCCFLL